MQKRRWRHFTFACCKVAPIFSYLPRKQPILHRNNILSGEILLVLRWLSIAAAYFITGWLGLRIPVAGSHITLFWLPTGIAVAALLRWGRLTWPGIWLGALCVNLATGAFWQLALGISMGNTLGPMLAAECLLRSDFHAAFDRRRDVGLLIVAAAIGMLLSASGGIVSLVLFKAIPPPAIDLSWLCWWMGDTTGVLLAAPLLLTLNRHSLEPIAAYRREALLWTMLAVPVTWIAFIDDFGLSGIALPTAFVTLPLLVWAALRFGNTGMALVGLWFAALASIGTTYGRGALYQTDLQLSLFLLWAYISTLVLTGMLITALQAERLQVAQALSENEEKLRGLYELSPLGFALTDMQGHYIEFNEAFRAMCGYSAEELMALDYWMLTPRKYEAEEARQLESLQRTGRYGPYEKEYIRKDGSVVPLLLNGMLITRSDNRKYIWSIVEDITERKRIEADLRVAATAFDAQVGIMVTDANSVILRVNRAFTEETGYRADEAVGQTPRLLRSGRHNQAFYAAMWDSINRTGMWQGEIWDRRKSGEIYPKWMTVTAVKGEGGAVTHYISTQLDISARKAAEDAMKHLAFYDPLTHLPNRRLLLDRLGQALATCVRNRSRGALLFIDLDNFKTLNDTLGHESGDLLLQQVARRLRASVRESDTVARLGGDEFVVLLGDLSQGTPLAAGQVEIVGEKILSDLAGMYQLGDQEYHCTASIGVTLFGNHQETTGELLKQADMAMYQAKAAGRNLLHFFDPVTQAAVTVRATLEKDLRNAVREGQIIPYFQAQVEGTGRLTGAEILVRWRHPERGMVMPDQFIPMAEETGLILNMGKAVLAAACAQLVAWGAQPETSHLTLAVNVSFRQLRQPDFVEQVLSVLEGSGANPHRLKLEITESQLMDNVENTIAKMAALTLRGIDFALDDFGTGYSSLAYLKRLPLEKIKIDRSFVRDVLTDPNDAVIAKSIVALAQSLGLSVIAEGVETEEQRNFLAENGCHEYQGYLFGRPLPIEEFERSMNLPCTADARLHSGAA